MHMNRRLSNRNAAAWLRYAALTAVVLLFVAETGSAFDRDRFAVEVESGSLWISRNDVQIPNNTGTRFSLTDAAGSGPYFNYRIEATYNFNQRHGIRAVFAPIDIEDTAILDSTVLFAGETFSPGVETSASYKFNSYRFSYRYQFYEGPTWRWNIGFTAFIRDARIALRQDETFAEDTDIGFVPLAHLTGEAKIDDRWSFALDVDGMGAPQGRAIDVSAKMRYSFSDPWQLAFGYRAIEGGADVDSVYNFAWLHFAVASVRFRF
jgi:hypothetical protein